MGEAYYLGIEAGGTHLRMAAVDRTLKVCSFKKIRSEELSDAGDKAAYLESLMVPYFQEMGRKTAADYLLETDKPVLIMQGGKDFQVLPEEDFEGFKEILKDKENVSYKLYEDLNHVFVKGLYNDITKASKEYSVQQHVDIPVIKDIAEFIHSH